MFQVGCGWALSAPSAWLKRREKGFFRQTPRRWNPMMGSFVANCDVFWERYGQISREIWTFVVKENHVNHWHSFSVCLRLKKTSCWWNWGKVSTARGLSQNLRNLVCHSLLELSSIFAQAHADTPSEESSTVTKTPKWSLPPPAQFEGINWNNKFKWSGDHCT